MRYYMKFIVAVLTAATYAAQAAISDGTVTGTEAVGILTAAAIAVLVLLVPNAKNTKPPTIPPTGR